MLHPLLALLDLEGLDVFCMFFFSENDGMEMVNGLSLMIDTTLYSVIDIY